MGQGAVSRPDEPGGAPERAPLEPGTQVEVRNRFDGRWVQGFSVDSLVEGGYRILRLSDRSVLPEVFSRDEVRRRRDRHGFWWH